MIWWAAALLTAAEPTIRLGVEDGIAAAAQGDNARAVAIWAPLARDGDPEANFRLAEAYQAGRGVPVSILRARQLYSRAAKECHAPAQASLALLDIASGRRAPALRLLRASAANNEPRALLFYGLALFNGDGVPLDRDRGYAMVKRAVALGLVDAAQTLSEMDVVMSVNPPQRAQTTTSVTPQASLTSPAPSLAVTDTRPARTMPVSNGEQPLPTARAAAPAGSGGGWRIQLGAFRRPGAPQELFASVSPRLPGMRAFYPAQNGLTALQVGPFTSRAEAQAACRLAASSPCVAVKAR
jgi:cell division septation protein DedD